MNKFRPTTGPAEREELGAGVGGWVAGMSEEGGDTHRTCKDRPHLLWGFSALQLSERQPTWAERLLVEYFNPCPCSLSPSQASRLSPKLTQLNIPSSKLGVSRGGNLSLALCPSSVLAPSSGVAAGSQAVGKAQDSISCGDTGLVAGRILAVLRKNHSQCGQHTRARVSGSLGSLFTAWEQLGVLPPSLGEKPSPEKQEEM